MHRHGELLLLMTIHVDDIKLCGHPSLMNAVVKQLESHFDAVKLEKDNFVHLSLAHSLNTVYISELREIPEVQLRSMSKDDLVGEQHKHLYRSLLGGVAWVTQTRLDIAVYVGSLQRKLQQPCVLDVQNLNRLLRYIKKHPLAMCFRRLSNPWRIVAISNFGFKGEGDDHLAIGSGLVSLVNKDFLCFKEAVSSLPVNIFCRVAQRAGCFRLAFQCFSGDVRSAGRRYEEGTSPWKQI